MKIRLKKLLFFLFLCIGSAGTKGYAFGINIDGIYYKLNGNNAVLTNHASGNTGYYGSIIIPNTVTYNGKTYNVTAIDDKAFFNCKYLESVTIPNSVTSIGDNAFSESERLTSINITNNVTYIGDGAFSITPWFNNQPDGLVYYGKIVLGYKGEMSQNTKIVIQEGTIGIAGGAFRYCKELESVTIPSGVTYIGNEAFSQCDKLKTLVVPNSVKAIGIKAFEGTAWYDRQPNGLIYVGKVAYKYKGNMPPNTKIQIKDGTLGIAGYAFVSTDNLKSVVIPNSVTSIGEGAFDRSGLTSVVIPNGVANIEGWTFNECANLISVTIPNSVTSIGSRAFYGCRNLKSLVIPNSVTEINQEAFCNCASLTSIDIPDSVTRIGYGAFYNCTGLIAVTISKSLITIAGDSFKGCSGLTSINIPNSVTQIGSEVFSFCTNLSSIVIPTSVINIGRNAFYGTKWYDNQPNGLIYAGSLVYKHKGENPIHSKIIIKEGTLGIATNAFSGCHGLKSVTIPESVKWIYDYAFAGCNGLASVNIPNKVEYIGSNAFEGCAGLSSIIIPNSVRTIGYGAFANCSGLKSVTISSNLKKNEVNFDYSTFKGCDNLETVFASPIMFDILKEVMSSNVRIIVKNEPEPIPSPTYNYATITWTAFQDKTTQKEYLLKLGINSDSKIESVTITVNGIQDRGIKTVNSSDYDLTINRTLTLNEGTNIIKVSVRNAAGMAQEEKTIVYRPHGGELPSIEWLDFAATANKKEYQMKLGIKSKSKVEEVNVTLNGALTRGIKTVASDGYGLTVDRTLSLSEGLNRIVVSVRNGDGISTSEKVITYQGNNPTPVFNDKRIAFVIGNSHYSNSEMNLANPENDAKDVAEKLKGLGFEVVLKLDATLEDMDRELTSFGQKAKEYDVAMFYYAGHGIQSKGVNYLIPTNIDNLAEDNMKYKCVDMERVLDVMEDSKCKLKIVILDACRNDPVSRKWHRSAGSRGLSLMNAPIGTIISFSTAPGSTALDGKGRNSPYTEAFLNTLDMPNLDVFHFFQKVGASVLDKTQRSQNPWLSISFTGDFYFNKQ